MAISPFESLRITARSIFVICISWSIKRHHTIPLDILSKISLVHRSRNCSAISIRRYLRRNMSTWIIFISTVQSLRPMPISIAGSGKRLRRNSDTIYMQRLAYCCTARLRLRQQPYQKPLGKPMIETSQYEGYDAGKSASYPGFEFLNALIGINEFKSNNLEAFGAH